MAHGRPGPAPQWLKREPMRSIDRSRRLERRSLPHHRHQPANRETLATGPDNQQHQWPAVALSACDQSVGSGDLGEVPVRGRAGPDRGLRRAEHGVRAIAVTMARSAATVSRELHRNIDPANRLAGQQLGFPLVPWRHRLAGLSPISRS
jgi:hypothetical protein